MPRKVVAVTFSCVVEIPLCKLFCREILLSTLRKAALAFVSVDKIVDCEHSIPESYWAGIFCGGVCDF